MLRKTLMMSSLLALAVPMAALSAAPKGRHQTACG
jgi:hypothetical protein